MGEGSITRRTALGRAAAMGASAFVPAAAARGQGTGHSISSRYVGRVDRESPVLAAPREFSLVAVQWAGPVPARIELRALGADGRWSAWATASALGHEPDGSPRVRGLFGEPLWMGSSVAVQVRSAPGISGLRLHFVSVRADPGARQASAIALAQPVLPAGPGQPAIIARRSWAQGQAPPGPFAGFGTVKLGFVHHTVNPNGYAAADVPAMLRAVFDFHRYVRGYFDIAYNFLIDAYRRIWEG